MKEKEPKGLKPNRIQQAENMALLDKCFWRGKWWENGIPNPRVPFKGSIKFNGNGK